MSFEKFIARRYLRSKQQTLFINIIMLVSLGGVTIGVAALIVVLSVFNGFNKVVTDVLVGFDPHVRILPSLGRSFQMTDSLVHALNSAGIQGWSPYVESKALLVSKNGNRVAMVKGVEDSAIGKVSGVRQATVVGKFDFGEDRSGIVVGMSLADRLGIIAGSELTIVSPVGIDAMIVQYTEPEMRKCVVAGIYDSRNKEYDTHYAFISIDVARKLFQYSSAVSGVEIRLDDIKESERMRVSLQTMLGPKYSVLSWYDLHKDLYSVMKIERWGAYIILCLIIGVATFNMLGSLTMGVIEKRRDIGILKSLGANNRSILRLFMFEGLLVGTVGTVLGLTIGLVVCYLQIHYQLFPLDPNVYIIPAIPVDIRWSDFLSIGLASMLLCTSAALYPARRAARLLPVEAIRWE